ncbi:MAG: GatB/YqeY domain-containing protein [Chloroflexi bacterium]|nr:GatB/YqeY domain-containing protein [Chloroflexota bacterium]
MSLKQQLQDDLKAAMKARDETRKSTLRMVLSAITYAEVEQGGDLDDDQVLQVLRKQADQYREALHDLQQAGRTEALAQQEAELRIVQAYLPAQLGREDIERAAREVIAATGASSLRDLGKVMPPLMSQLRGQADGKLVNQVVRELLG